MDSLAGDMFTAQQNLFNDPVSVVIWLGGWTIVTVLLIRFVLWFSYHVFR